MPVLGENAAVPQPWLVHVSHEADFDQSPKPKVWPRKRVRCSHQRRVEGKVGRIDDRSSPLSSTLGKLKLTR